jgi:hypothetical protein
MTYNGGALSSGVKLYINGINVDDTDSENDTFVAVEDLTHAVWIGRYSTTYANGKIGGVTIYNRVLTANEVAYLYGKPLRIFEPKKHHRY